MEGRDTGEVNARIVYWGVHGAGKRTNLRVIHAKLRPDHRGELRDVPTRLDPTTSYALLPIELGEVGGVRTRIQVLTAPAGAEQAPTRKQLLDRADGVVFVADAQRERLGENLACFEELRTALSAYGRALEQVPLVIQYNKRDLSDPYVLEELHRKLGMRGVAAFEAVAREGTAVLQTLTTISKRVIRHRRETSAGAGFEPDAEPHAPAPPPGTTQLLTRMVEPEPPEPEPLELESDFEPAFEDAAPGPAPAPGPLFAVKGLGSPAAVDAQTIVVPVRLRDGSGRVRQLSLRLRVEAIEDEGA